MFHPFSKINAAHSFIHNLDPRVRIVSAVVFAGLISVSKRFPTLGVGFGCSLLMVTLARMISWNTVRRFLAFNGFMVFLLIFIPLSVPGEPLIHVGGLNWSLEGVLRAAMITLKANTIMLIFMAFLTTMEPVRLGSALNKLGCPAKLVHLFLFAVRYVEVIYHEYARLINALRLRCFRPGFNRHTFRTYGYLVGMLLVRSLERSERIFEAMKCRGFRNRFYTLAVFRLTVHDLLFMIVGASILMFLSWCEWVWLIH